jgi:hypothetical protein
VQDHCLERHGRPVVAMEQQAYVKTLLITSDLRRHRIPTLGALLLCSIRHDCANANIGQITVSSMVGERPCLRLPVGRTGTCCRLLDPAWRYAGASAAGPGVIDTT